MVTLENIRTNRQTNGLRMLGQGAVLLENMNHGATTVAKLINLPRQRTLFVLRVCVQQNL
jgi:hypothetical protein